LPGHLRLPPFLGLVALGLIYWFLPERFSFVPNWSVLLAVALLFVPINWAHLTGRHTLVRSMAIPFATGISGLVGGSAFLLVVRLPTTEIPARELLGIAGLIWGANVLAFAFWYWEVDGGGPMERHRSGYREMDFVFPQKAIDLPGSMGWQPTFLDYLFLAFNTSTAFSPTDTLVLTARAKGLMMTQSAISLVVLAMIAARAINTL
jgi:hypothetical protein